MLACSWFVINLLRIVAFISVGCAGLLFSVSVVFYQNFCITLKLALWKEFGSVSSIYLEWITSIDWRYSLKISQTSTVNPWSGLL